MVNCDVFYGKKGGKPHFIALLSLWSDTSLEAPIVQWKGRHLGKFSLLRPFPCVPHYGASPTGPHPEDAVTLVLVLLTVVTWECVGLFLLVSGNF